MRRLVTLEMDPRRLLAHAVWLLFLSAAGCGTSGYIASFESAVDDPHPPIEAYPEYDLRAYEGEPKIRREAVTEDTFIRLLEEGFVLLGTSQFNGPREGDAGLREQARRIGAEVVVADATYARTETGVTPVTRYYPHTYHRQGSIRTDSGQRRVSEFVTVYSAQTEYIPYSTAQYDHFAAYWTRPLRPPILGARCAELTPEERKDVGRNQGVKVIASVRGSPAWNANLMPGDIILDLNDQRISGLSDLREAVERHAGETVTLTILRDGEPREMQAALRGP